MKAKEYFKRYVDDFPEKSNEWKIVKIFGEIFAEATPIAKARNAKRDNALRAIFRELNQKANSFCKMVNEIDDMKLRRDSFISYVEYMNQEFCKLVFPDHKSEIRLQELEPSRRMTGNNPKS